MKNRIKEVTLPSQNLNQESIFSKIIKDFNEIHEHLYTDGGIKPSNAAIDEIGKLLFIKIHFSKNPKYTIQSIQLKGILLQEIFEFDYIQKNSQTIIDEFKNLFIEINQLEIYKWKDSNGTIESIFPADEPLRISNAKVLGFAVKKLNEIWDYFEKNIEKSPTQDFFGQLYEVFLRGKYDGSGGLGTFLTPMQVTECMTDMIFESILDDHHGILDSNFYSSLKIGDICCGTGRFLITALNFLLRTVSKSSNIKNEDKGKLEQIIKRNVFFGADQSVSSICKARINFLLYDGDYSKLNVVEDSLYDSKLESWKDFFTVLLTNPPFGENKYNNMKGLDYLRQADHNLGLGWSLKEPTKPLKSVDPALLFLDRNLQLLKSQGYLAIVIPDGLLANESLIHYLFGHFNEKLGQMQGGKAIPIAIVSLPTVTFSISGAVAKTSFLIMQKKDFQCNSRHPQKVLFAAAEHVGFLKKGNIAIPDPKGNDLKIISDTFKRFLQEKEQFKHSESVHIITKSENLMFTTLDPWHYNKKIDSAKNSIQTSGLPLDKIGNLATIRPKQSVRMDAQYNYFISILHINEILEIDWNAALQYRPTSGGQCCYPGDILVSCINPRITRIAVIPLEITGKVICSPEFVVLIPKQNMNPYYLALSLCLPNSMEQIISKATGTSSSRRRLKKEYILEVLIPLLDETKQMEYASGIKTAIENITSGREKKNLIFQSLKEIF